MISRNRTRDSEIRKHMDSLANFLSNVGIFRGRSKNGGEKGETDGGYVLSPASPQWFPLIQGFGCHFPFFGKSSLAIWYLLSANHR